jgi:hypothetical protein
MLTGFILGTIFGCFLGPFVLGVLILLKDKDEDVVLQDGMPGD